MEMLYTVSVYSEEATILENLLNKFRIGMNKWNKSRVFDYTGYKFVNYAIICTEEMYISIINFLNKLRVY